jgi:hypothetical protein
MPRNAYRALRALLRRFSVVFSKARQHDLPGFVRA